MFKDNSIHPGKRKQQHRKQTNSPLASERWIVTGSVEFCSSSKNFGPMVKRSQPARLRISPAKVTFVLVLWNVVLHTILTRSCTTRHPWKISCKARFNNVTNLLSCVETKVGVTQDLQHYITVMTKPTYRCFWRTLPWRQFCNQISCSNCKSEWRSSLLDHRGVRRISGLYLPRT